MTDPNGLTLFRIRMLATLCGLDRPTGQELKQALQANVEGAVIDGRLYENLRCLSDAELVAWGWIDGRTKWYDITEGGEDVLEREHRFLRARVV